MKHYRKIFFVLLLLGIGLVFLNLYFGSVRMNWGEIWEKDSTDSVIFQYRMAKIAAAIFCGMALSVSGMLLQEYFKNVLAGPSIMGISSSAGLGIALLIFTGMPTMLTASKGLHYLSVAIAGMLGALACLLILLSISKQMKDASHFIIVGFLISALASACIGVLQLYSGNEELKQYVIWSFGSFSGLSNTQLILFALGILIGLGVACKALHSLQGNILGEDYARSVGVNLSTMKIAVLCATSILTGISTSMVGPIAFVGIIVPFFTRLWISEAQLYRQFWINTLMGACLLLAVNGLSELTRLPLNILTSFLGIPLMVYIVLKSSYKS